jgi:hypothetical protein
MKQFLESLQSRLEGVKDFKYIDEDWGQLDDYGPHAPVKYPCCLIDVTSAQFSDIGMHRAAKPINRQEGTASITLTFANLKLSNTSAKAPVGQKEKAWMLYDLIDKAHQEIHGFRPTELSGSLVRSSFKRVKRDDGVQVYQVMYTMGMHNV